MQPKQLTLPQVRWAIADFGDCDAPAEPRRASFIPQEDPHMAAIYLWVMRMEQAGSSSPQS
jgi:hypothetical protein